MTVSGAAPLAAPVSDVAAGAATSEIVMIKRYWQWILQSIAVHCVSTSHLLCQNSPNGDLLRGGSMERLDQTDELILAELAQDARATYAEIGQRVNLSAPAVKR